MTQFWDIKQKKFVESNTSPNSGASSGGSNTADPYQDPNQQNKLREMFMGAAAKKGQFGTAASILNTISKQRSPDQVNQDKNTATILSKQLDNVTSQWQDPGFFQSNQLFRMIGGVQDRSMSPTYDTARKAFYGVVQQLQADKRLPGGSTETKSYNDLFPDQWDTKGQVQKKVEAIQALLNDRLNSDPPAIAQDPNTGSTLSIQDELNNFLQTQGQPAQ